MNTTNHKGFSLVELMVVISIFGVIVAFAVPAFNKYSASQQLNGGTETLAGAFKLARQRAMSTGSRELIHVNTGGGVDWHIHSYRTSGTVLVWGKKFPPGITTYTVAVSPHFQPDGRSTTSGLIVLRDLSGRRDTVSVLNSGLILTQ